MNQKQRICLGLLLLLSFGTLAGAVPTAGVKQAARLIDELIRSLDDAAEHADEAARAFSASLKKLQRIHADDIPRPMFDWLNSNWRRLPDHTFQDAALLKFAAAHGEHAPSVLELARRAPVKDLGRRLVDLEECCGNDGLEVISVMAGKLPLERSRELLRGIGGRQLSQKQIENVVEELRRHAGSGRAAEVFELMARRQIECGPSAARAGIRKGSQVIDGRYDGVRGIDGIGVSPDGSPIVIEATIDSAKNLPATGQLSSDWIAKRWNELIERRPEVVRDLRANGVRDEFLKPVDATVTSGWGRKLVAPNDDCLTEANRLGVVPPLGINDLIVLGRP